MKPNQLMFIALVVWLFVLTAGAADEPPVAMVEQVAKKHGTSTVAQAYLEYLYSNEGQDIAGRNFYRPRSEKAAAKYAGQFAPLKLVTVDEVFGGWQKAQKIHFAAGGVFDQIFQP